MAHHFHNTLETMICQRHQHDWVEFMIHHLATVFAMGLSYLANHVDIGVSVLLAHDLADSLLNMGKIFRHSKKFNRTLIDIIFSGIIFCWLYGRIFTMFYCLIRRALNMFVLDYNPKIWYNEFNSINLFCTGQLLLIFGLNFFWFIMIIQVAVQRVFGKNYVVKYYQDHKDEQL